YDGTYTIHGGTRRYRHATGKGTFTEHRTYIGQRNRTGHCHARTQLTAQAAPAHTRSADGDEWRCGGSALFDDVLEALELGDLVVHRPLNHRAHKPLETAQVRVEIEADASAAVG